MIDESKKLIANSQKLTAPISSLAQINRDHAAGLARLHIETISDLLRHFPTRYADMREVGGTSTLVKGQAVSIYGIMEKVSVRRSFRGHVPMTEARIADNAGTIRAIWFNQAYIGKMYPDGTKVKVMGIIQEDSKGFLLSNPSIEKVSSIPESSESLFASVAANDGPNAEERGKNTDASFLTPVYPETKGVTSLYLYTLIKKAVTGGAIKEVIDPIPEHILNKLHLPLLQDALMYIHFPKNESLNVHQVLLDNRLLECLNSWLLLLESFQYYKLLLLSLPLTLPE